MPRRRRAPKRRRVRARRTRYVARPMVREEMKTLDYNPGVQSTLPLANDNTAPVGMLCLNIVPQGTTAITRLGKKILMKALQIRGCIQPPVTSTLNWDKVSLLLVYVRSNNQDAAVPPYTTLLTRQSTFGLTNRDNASKFKILRRWDYVVAGTRATPTDILQIPFDEYIVFKKPLVTQWTQGNSTGVYSAMEKGGLLLIGMGDNIATASNGFWNFIFESRLYFGEDGGYMF